RYRRNVQFIFQHAKASLNPHFTIEEVLLEPLWLWDESFEREKCRKQIKKILEKVRLPENVLRKYPGELSGGQAQRVAIARGLLLRPEVIICDEAVSALDASVQKQILDLLKELQREFQMSYLFITHDMGVVNYIADEVIVMKNGRVIESGPKDQVLYDPKEEYTKTLIASSFLF
ncbi:MAG: ATP-binding cassette domain-containing protein, partial [Caldibacillus sp.]